MNKASTIRPIVIYPFAQPNDLTSMTRLYEMLKILSKEEIYSKPITIVNNQTKYRISLNSANQGQLGKIYQQAISQIVQPASNVIETWAVDTCAMWLRGLGDSFQLAETEGAIHDVFWLISIFQLPRVNMHWNCCLQYLAVCMTENVVFV